MIIGISGKIGSGKDTVGKIIQYLDYYKWYQSKRETEEVIGTRLYFKEFMDVSLDKPYGDNHWEIKKFAGKLKDIVCLLIGCTREQLEDIDFKNKELGDEWIFYGYANGFDKQHRDGIEQVITTMNVIPCTKERYEEELRVNWQTAYKRPMTPRLMLQLLGTEAGRQIIHPNIWINALFADYYKVENLDKVPKERRHLYKPCNWIITDVRFPNEAQAIKDRGGIVLRIDRDTIIKDNEGEPIRHDKSYSNIDTTQHPSETALDDYKFDRVIDNNGTLEDLIENVKEVLINFNVI